MRSLPELRLLCGRVHRGHLHQQRYSVDGFRVLFGNLVFGRNRIVDLHGFVSFYRQHEFLCGVRRIHLLRGGYTGTRATNASYFAALLPDGGISGWAATTSYPFPVFSQSCVGWGGYIYCVGGYQTGGLPTSLVYFAELSSSGIGAWRASASYPTNVTSQSCVPTGGYLYCIGGITDSKPPVSSSVFSSPLSPSGLAGWSGTTAYPTAIDIESCFPEAGDVYCVGGAPNFEATDAVYYSEASSSGELGQWAIGSAYPSRIGELSCIPIDSNAYCVGGASSASDHSSRVYRAGLTTSSSATTYLVSSPTDSSSSSARSSSMTGSPVSSSLGASYLAVVIILPVVAYVCWASVRRPNAS